MENEKSTLQEFFDKLTFEEDGIKLSLKEDTLGLSLRVSLNELDWYNYNMARHASEESIKERSYILLLGVTRIVYHMLSIHKEFTVPTITLRRHEDLSAKILKISSHFGCIQHGRRVAESARTGLARIIQTEPDYFEFILPKQLIDRGAHERTVEEHYNSEYRRIRDEALETAAGKKTQEEVRKLLTDNVFIFREYFMGYNADSFLDEYFFTLAWLILQTTHGYDSFNELKTFGGVPYLKYLIGSAYFISLCLKHESFCEAMIVKEPQILLQDILTISADREGFIEDLREALNAMGVRFKNYTKTTLKEAEKIYEVLALTRKNVSILNRPWAPLPCIIEFSGSAIIKLIYGRVNQMDFLLKSLKYYFPQEYDTHQRSRELSMQRALHSLFKENFEEIAIRMNTKLRLNRKEITDVDFSLIDIRYGDLFLFQLKHQDRPGPDILADFSKMTRFREESVRWLTAVDQWINSVGSLGIRATFHVPRNVEIKRIRKIVIARYHAHALADVNLDENTAYAAWIQIINAVELMKEKQGDFRTLNGFFGILRQHIVGAKDEYHYNEEPVEFYLNNLTFLIRQDQSDNNFGI